MQKEKKKKLEASGWRVAGTSDFLGLSESEAEFIEFKLALARKVKERRLSQGLSQSGLAKAMGSSQSRIAKLEAADASVSADLMLKSYFLLGAKRRDVLGL
ncbi:MAG: ribosome-binding protein aMBF1 (putative translation factor) [Rhodothermales bacterium]|jgi:ribosome-binding protein aMBF1 (putative translation factor)